MEEIARLMVASTDLIEAEGRALRRTLSRFLLASGFGVLAILLMVMGFAYLLYGGFRFLSDLITVPGAAGVFGVVALGLAFGALLYARHLVFSKHGTPVVARDTKGAAHV